jgi:hypothetical protein
MGRWAQAKRRGAVRHTYTLVSYGGGINMLGTAGISFIGVSWAGTPAPDFFRVKLYSGAFPGFLAQSTDVPGNLGLWTSAIIPIAGQTWYAEVQAWVGGIPQRVVRSADRTY